MRELFLKYAEEGAMTMAELAKVLKRTESWVRVNSGEGRLIPRLPGRPIRFDPMAMIDVFCKSAEVKRPNSSLTIKRQKTGGRPTGGYRKCL